MSVLTEEQAKVLAESGWWEDMPAEKVAQFQLHTDRLCMPFGEFHQAVEEAIGRPVWTHEFARPESLRAELAGEKEAPDNPAAHAIRSLSEMLEESGRDPAECMAIVLAD